MADEPEIRMARSFCITSCPHGSVNIDLMDDNGVVFARASMGPQVAMDAAEIWQDVLAESIAILSLQGAPPQGSA